MRERLIDIWRRPDTVALESIPVSKRTVGRLNTVAREKLGGSDMAWLSSDNGSYQIFTIGRRTEIIKGEKEIGSLHTHYIVTRPDTGSKFFVPWHIGKSTYHTVENPMTGIPSLDEDRMAELLRRTFKEFDTQREQQTALTAMTGIPETTEGEIRRVIADIKGGTIQSSISRKDYDL